MMVQKPEWVKLRGIERMREGPQLQKQKMMPITFVKQHHRDNGKCDFKDKITIQMLSRIEHYITLHTCLCKISEVELPAYVYFWPFTSVRK